MTIKTLFIAASLTVSAVFFSNCTKDATVPEIVQSESGKDQEASLRGTCKVRIAASNSALNICGAQNSAIPCTSLVGINLYGSDVINNNASAQYNLTTPASLLISRTGVSASAFVTATVTTSAGTQVYNVPLTGTVQVNIANDCSL